MLPGLILVYNIVCINYVEFLVFITEKGRAEPYSLSNYTMTNVLDRYICC